MSCCKRKRVDNEEEDGGLSAAERLSIITDANSWFGSTDGYQYEKVVGITNPTLRQRFSRNVIEVHPLFENGSYKTSTIELALVAVSALSPIPSSTNHTVILLHPGVHYISDGITIPASVHIEGMGWGISTISLLGPASQSHMFLLNDQCSISNCTIACNLQVTYCVLPNTSCNSLRLYNLFVTQWNTSFLRNTGSTSGCLATLSDIDGLTSSVISGAMIDVVTNINTVKGSNVSIQQGTTFLRAQTGGILHITGATAKTCSAQVATSLGTNAYVGVDGLQCQNCIGVPIFNATSSSILMLTSVSMVGTGNSGQFLQNIDNTAFVSINGHNATSIYSSTASIWNGTRGSQTCAFTTDSVGTNGGKGFKMFGDMYMGHPTNPSSLTVGSGGKYASIIASLDYNSSNTLLTDRSSACLNGTTHAFPVRGLDYYTLIGDVYQPFIGWVMNIVTVGSSTNPADYAVEYYNGAAWVAVKYCVTGFNYPYVNYGVSLFPTTGYVMVTIDPTLLYDSQTSLWPSSVVNALTSRYYLRVRNVVNPVTEATIQQLWVVRTDMKIDLRGNVSYFGKSKTYKPLNLRYNDMVSHGGIALPSTTDLWLGTNVHFGTQYNTYAVGDLMGFLTFMPRDMDPSGPLVLNIAYISDSTGGAQASFTMSVVYGHALNADLIQFTATGTARDETSVSTTLQPNQTNGRWLTYQKVLLPVNFLIPRAPTTINNYDILGLQLTRTVGNPGNNLIICAITLSYLSCMDGVSLFYQ